MTAVKSSEFQKNVGYWIDRSRTGPVRISRYDRTAAVLISGEQYEELLASYRKRIDAADLTDADMATLSEARVETDHPFTLDDLPDVALREKARQD